jgi:hypothetical protein
MVLTTTYSTILNKSGRVDFFAMFPNLGEKQSFTSEYIFSSNFFTGSSVSGWGRSLYFWLSESSYSFKCMKVETFLKQW